MTWKAQSIACPLGLSWKCQVNTQVKTPIKSWHVEIRWSFQVGIQIQVEKYFRAPVQMKVPRWCGKFGNLVKVWPSAPNIGSLVPFPENYTTVDPKQWVDSRSAWGTRPKTWNSSSRINEHICKKCHTPLCIRLFCSASLALLQR